MQVNWKHKSIGNISQFETRLLIVSNWIMFLIELCFQLTCASNWLAHDPALNLSFKEFYCFYPYSFSGKIFLTSDRNLATPYRNYLHCARNNYLTRTSFNALMQDWCHEPVMNQHFTTLLSLIACHTH